MSGILLYRVSEIIDQLQAFKIHFDLSSDLLKSLVMVTNRST